MTQFHIFVIRALLGLGFAVVVTRMFFGQIDIPYVIGLAVILVGLAYLSEFLRNRRKG